MLAQGQWGSGPIKVAIVTKGHNFDRDGFFNFWDSLGQDITWTHLQHPAALEFFDPAIADTFDVYAFYDAPGRTATPGTRGQADVRTAKRIGEEEPDSVPAEGKGLVFFHHSPAAWNHTWPEYGEMIGMACDWGNEVTFKGKTYPNSGAQGGVKQRITVVNKTHPITQGIGDGFEIVDETYLCPVDEKAKGLIPLLRTDFEPIDKNFPGRYAGGWRYPGVGSNLAGWVRTAEKSPLVYLQNGHDAVAWKNPAFQTLMRNSIKWAASQEARDWAAKNPTKVRKPRARVTRRKAKNEKRKEQGRAVNRGALFVALSFFVFVFRLRVAGGAARRRCGSRRSSIGSRRRCPRIRLDEKLDHLHGRRRLVGEAVGLSLHHVVGLPGDGGDDRILFDGELERAGDRDEHVERDVVVHVRPAHRARLQRDLQHAHVRVFDDVEEVHAGIGIACLPHLLAAAGRLAVAGAWPVAGAAVGAGALAPAQELLEPERVPAQRQARRSRLPFRTLSSACVSPVLAGI